MEWFEEWFDTPLFEELYAYRDDAEAKKLADHLVNVIPVETYPNILDLGCGRGRHSINMAVRNYNVTGIDLSEVAIKKARRKAEEQNLEIEFLVGDMRTPLNRKFDAIINLFTSFGYFEDDDENRRVLQSMSKMVHSDGMIVIDYLNAANVINQYVPTGEGRIGDVHYTITRFIEDDTINKKMVFQSNEDDEEQVYNERVKLYDIKWFEQNLADFGIKIIRTYGDYDLGDYDEKASPRLLMICKAE